MNPQIDRSQRRSAACGLLVIAFALVCTCASASAAPFDPHRVIVRFSSRLRPAAVAAGVRQPGVASATTSAGHTRVLRLAPGTSVAATLRLLRREPGVVYAEPDYVAHASEWVPNDPGAGNTPGGWQLIQWNFVGPYGVNALQAWANLSAVGAFGGKGVTIAVLDTGVAYTDHGRFRRSPDFGYHQFVKGYDFVGNNAYPVDHNGHGTHVAGTIAEATNNGIGLTGLAYGARIMPVRVLNSQGDGDASAIAAGVRFAVKHHAQVINLSLEFTSDVTASSIPDLISAIRFAHRHGVLVVAAAGNEGRAQIAYPARAKFALSVGATTEHGCLSVFSNDGPHLDLVAPGGGADAPLLGDPKCHPDKPAGRDIYQETFLGNSVRRFGLPGGYEGTSMATPHVAATAALIIASGVIGAHPTPDAIVARLEATARKLGDPNHYGAGLIDAAAATAPGPPAPAPAPASPATP